MSRDPIGVGNRPASTRAGLVISLLQLVACAADGDGSGDRGVRPPVGSTSGQGGSSGSGGATPSGSFGNPIQPSLAGASGNGAAAGSGGRAGSGAECGAVTQMAQNMLQPADIIIGIDTSGSMAEEIAEVQQNMNRVLAADHRQRHRRARDPARDPAGHRDAGRLRWMALASRRRSARVMCPADSNPPSYVHLNQMVASWDVLDVYINAYPSYKAHLRENSLKTFVTITDDNADSETSPFAIIGGTGHVHHSADDFIAAVATPRAELADVVELALLGHLQLHAVPLGAVRAVGAVHADLVQRTEVSRATCACKTSRRCSTSWPRASRLRSRWRATGRSRRRRRASPSTGKTNVQLTLDGAVEQLPKVPDVSTCGAIEGWHYDDEAAPSKVVACPSTCARIQAAAEAQVDLLFGCQTVTVE